MPKPKTTKPASAVANTTDTATLNPRPGQTYLCQVVDDLAANYEKCEEQLAELKAERDQWALAARKKEEELNSIKEYLVKHMTRLGLGSVAGDTFTALLGESQPVFSFEGKPEEIPGIVAKRTITLDKGACKSLYESGQLPDVIQVSKTAYVKFQAA